MRCMPWVLIAANAALPFPMMVSPPRSRRRASRPGTLIAADRHDAGNLRRFFPEARIVRMERPAYAPPMRAADLAAQVAVVWRKGSEKRLPKDAKSEFGGSRQRRPHARTRGCSLAALSAGFGGAKVDSEIVVGDPGGGKLRNLFLGYRDVMLDGQQILANGKA